MLKDAIQRNRIRTARYDRASRVLRHIRIHIYDYDAGQAEKAHKVMDTCKRILAPLWEAQRDASKGKWSGLTPTELAASGTVETDWY